MSGVPGTMKTHVLVVSKFEDPDVLQSRRAASQSKSVSELSQISSLADVPIPKKIEQLTSTLRRSKSGDNLSSKKREAKDTSRGRNYEHLSPMALHDTIYSTLPRSLKTEVVVRSKVNDSDSDVVKERKDLVQSKSVGELSEIRTLADVPLPRPIENIIYGRRKKDNDQFVDALDSVSQQTG